MAKLFISFLFSTVLKKGHSIQSNKQSYTINYVEYVFISICLFKFRWLDLSIN